MDHPATLSGTHRGAKCGTLQRPAGFNMETEGNTAPAAWHAPSILLSPLPAPHSPWLSTTSHEQDTQHQPTWQITWQLIRDMQQGPAIRHHNPNSRSSTLTSRMTLLCALHKHLMTGQGTPHQPAWQILWQETRYVAGMQQVSVSYGVTTVAAAAAAVQGWVM